MSKCPSQEASSYCCAAAEAEERAAEERAAAVAVKSQYIDRRFQTLPQR